MAMPASSSSPLTLEALAGSANALAPEYSAFRVSERLWLTGHSHQAWPDVGFGAQKRAWQDAANYADDKWDAAFEQWDRVCRGYADLLGDTSGDITLASNTHELVVRFLSGLSFEARPRIVATDGEFHSARRQLDRLAEERLIELVKVPAYPAADVAQRLAGTVDDRTACVVVSSVFFERGHIVPNLGALAETCRAHGAELLVDTYHSLGAMPFSLADHGLEHAFVVGGGYKYLQLGEGNCFLRAPADCEMRPVVTGWFSEFAELADEKTPGEVRYGKGAARFAGSTYDPTSHYRGAAVMEFFERKGLTPAFLREVSVHQVGLLESTFRGLDLDPAVARLDDTVGATERGGFLALECGDAAGLSGALRERGVRTDFRGAWLRFGPAPYHSDRQLVDAMNLLGEAVKG